MIDIHDPTAGPTGAVVGGPSCCLIVENDVFVASDMSEAVTELYPGAAHRSCRSVAEAEALFAGGVAVDIAVIGTPGDRDGLPRLLDRLASGGARWVLLTDRQQPSDSPRQVTIPRPFVTDSLLGALRRLEELDPN